MFHCVIICAMNYLHTLNIPGRWINRLCEFIRNCFHGEWGSLNVREIIAVLCGVAMIRGGGGSGVTAVPWRWYRCQWLATFWRAVLFARDPMWSPSEPPCLFLLLCQRHWIFINVDTLVSQCSIPYPVWPAGPSYWCLLAPHRDVYSFSHPISISV